jgi:Phytanoyl-CoA dioxygenase (PhyH)
MELASRPVTGEEYVHYREQGFLIVRGLLAADEVQELLDHVDDLLTGRVEIPDAPSFGGDNKTPEARLERLLRIHMLHRRLEIHERYLLHPGILDVVAALVGPDVLALQTMLFVKRPGSAGQGHHQDSFHIITQPDTLVGAWVALDRADEENGCLWITPGSQNEPVYPEADEESGQGGDVLLADIPSISGADDPERVPQRPDSDRSEARRPGAARGPRSRRRRLLQRPRAPPLPHEPQRDAFAPLVRGPLLQRPLLRTVGRRAARAR